MDDKMIIDLFFSRSENALSELERKYGISMQSISYNILKNREDAEECVNEAYMSLWNAIPPERPEPLFAFASRVVRNISLNRYKHNKAKKRGGGFDIALEEIADIIPSEQGVEAECENNEIREALNDYLATLSSENLYIFMRRYWYMEDVRDISRAMNISDQAVYLRIDRMKKKLNKFLEKRGVIK